MFDLILLTQHLIQCHRENVCEKPACLHDANTLPGQEQISELGAQVSQLIMMSQRQRKKHKPLSGDEDEDEDWMY